jgi:hypothetical protein
MITDKMRQRDRERWGMRKEHPELFFCACGNRGAAFLSSEIICERCRKIEAMLGEENNLIPRYKQPLKADQSNIPDEFHMGDSLKHLGRLLACAV